MAAAQVVTNHANGSQTLANIFNSPCAPGACLPVPIDLSEGTSTLVLYGTGLGKASLADVIVQIGAQTLPASFAGPAPGYVGLDPLAAETVTGPPDGWMAAAR